MAMSASSAASGATATPQSANTISSPSGPSKPGTRIRKRLDGVEMPSCMPMKVMLGQDHVLGGVLQTGDHERRPGRRPPDMAPTLSGERNFRSAPFAEISGSKAVHCSNELGEHGRVRDVDDLDPVEGETELCGLGRQLRRIAEQDRQRQSLVEPLASSRRMFSSPDSGKTIRCGRSRGPSLAAWP